MFQFGVTWSFVWVGHAHQSLSVATGLGGVCDFFMFVYQYDSWL